jgi:hypothetical protein
MSLAPFRFELVFTGLCLFDFDDHGATVLLVNASNPKRFQSDPDFAGLDEFIPHPHFSSFSYLMTQQIRQGVDDRRPDRVFAEASGEEVGVCDLEGEDLVLKTSPEQPFAPGSLSNVLKLSELVGAQYSSLCSSPLPNFAVTTRLHFNQGALETRRRGFAGDDILKIDFRTINTMGTDPENPEREVADQLVLIVKDLTEPVEIVSDSFPSKRLLLRPDLDSTGNSLRPVVASLANYHREYHQPAGVASDFLWFYELLDFSPGPRPSRLDLPVPFARNGPGGFTGSSALCPPIHS